MTLLMDKKSKIKGKRIVITHRFINANLPMEVKWLLIDVFNNSQNYELDYGLYKNLLSKYDMAVIEQFSRYANHIRVSPDRTKIYLDRDGFKRFGIYTTERKPSKPVEVDTNKAMKLLECYNNMRKIFYEKKKEYYQPIVNKPHMMGTYKKVIDNLEQHNIDDWYLFFYCLFESKSWNMVWSLKSCGTPYAIDIYHNWKDKCLNKIKQQQLQEAEALDNKEGKLRGDKLCKYTDLIDHIERKKKRYLEKGQEKVCMQNLDQTLGYHPLSDNCTSCPIADNCKKAIYVWFQNASGSNLDIIKIRSRETPIAKAENHLQSINSSISLLED